MLVLGKKLDYALISLAWLSEHEGQYVSAREIAEANGLPLQALMQILKVLHQNGVLRSTRGVKGGYQIDLPLETLSLHALGEVLSEAEYPAMPKTALDNGHFPVIIMRQKLSRFLEDVTVAEVVRPGRQIDVPLHKLRILDRVTV